MDLSVSDDSQLVIVGDTHGQLEDVLWIFFKYGWPSKQTRYLFNGDIVDRSAARAQTGGNWLDWTLGKVLGMNASCLSAVFRLVAEFQTPQMWPKLHRYISPKKIM